MEKVLINYEAEEKEYLPILAGILKRRGYNAAATTNVLSIGDIQKITQRTAASAIVLANTETLSNFVQTPGKTKASLDSFRGSRLNYNPPVLVINSLSHIHAVPYGRFILEKDLDKLAYKHIPALQVSYTVCDTKETCDAALAKLSGCSILSIDIETDGHTRITCFGVTGLLPNGRTCSYIIPFHDFGIDHFISTGLFAYAISTMQRICLTDIPKCMFNATYDAQYLVKYHAWPRNLIFDVMGLAHSQYSELPKTLDFVASLYCYDYYQWKVESRAAHEENNIRGYWHYCVKDSWFTLRCLLAIWKQYPAYAIKNYQIQFKLTYPSIYCSYEGILIEQEELKKERAAAQLEIDRALADLKTITRCKTFNPGSPKQVGVFIYDILGAKKIKEKSTDKKILARVAEQHPLLARVIDDVFTYRTNSKAISTYYDFVQWNGRLMYSLSPFTTDTARFSSKASNFWCGTQIQNQPERAKVFLIADDGYALIEKDNDKSEARCVAFLAPCPTLKEVLGDREKDFYLSLGTIFFGIPYEEVTKDLRNKVLKRIVHGTNYMMGVNTFIMNTGAKQLYDGAGMLGMKVASLQQFVKFLLGIYHTKFPEVAKHYQEIKLEILRTSKLTSPLGYTRYFFGNIVENHEVLRGAVAHEPQNLSVGILNKGFWKAWKICLESNGEFRLKCQIHDSIFGQSIKEKTSYYSDLLDKAMYNPVEIKGDLLVIPVSTAVGHSWKSLKT